MARTSLSRRLAVITAQTVLVAGALTACFSPESSEGGAADTFEAGALLGMTGPNASYGEQHSQGINMAMEEINDSDRASGVELSVKIEDHQGQAQKGVLALNKLVSVDDVTFVFNSFTNVISATAPIATKDKVVMINGGGTAPTLAGMSPYLFSNVPLESNHIENASKYAIETQGLKTLGILYVNDALGTADEAAMQETWADLGGEVIDSQSAPTDATDFKAQLSQLAAKSPDAIYVAAGGQQVATILNQKAELGITAQIIGTSFWTIPEVVTSAKGASDGIIFSTQQWDPANPANDAAKKFVEGYTAKYGTEPLGNAAAYYVATYILADVIADLKDDDKAFSGPNIREAMLDHGTFDTIFGDLTFAEDGTSTMPISLMTVTDGQFTTIEQK